MKSAFVFAIAWLIILSLSFSDKNLAHADRDSFGNYFCGNDRGLEEDVYWIKVNGLNSDLETRSGSIEELNKVFMKEGGAITEFDKMADCLYNVHRVDPDNVIKFSDKAQAVLNYDYERLVEVAPNIANYVEVPEFGVVSMIVLAGGVSAILLLARNKMGIKS